MLTQVEEESNSSDVEVRQEAQRKRTFFQKSKPKKPSTEKRYAAMHNTVNERAKAARMRKLAREKNEANQIEKKEQKKPPKSSSDSDSSSRVSIKEKKQ